MAELIHTEISNGVATLSLHRPEVLNALNSELLQAVAAASAVAGRREEVQVLVLRGAGDRAFVAGADVKEMVSMSSLEGEAFSRAGQEAMAVLGALDQTVIAAVHGFALGGGFELALACDLIWASPAARFGFPETSLGLIPGFAGTQRLVRATGVQAARDLILSARRIDAMEALRMGAIARLVDAGDFFATVQAEAEKIAVLGPKARSWAKKLINAATETDLYNGSRAEAAAFGLILGAHDAREGITALLEKRKATFNGD